MRFFNTAGPVEPDIHYCLPPLHRWNLDAVLALIAQRKYFVLHAPRQTRKASIKPPNTWSGRRQQKATS